MAAGALATAGAWDAAQQQSAGPTLVEGTETHPGIRHVSVAPSAAAQGSSAMAKAPASIARTREVLMYCELYILTVSGSNAPGR
jgi:hypothetical protein